MADPKTQLKRQREETQEEENSKRCKSSLNHILSILEDDEEADSKFSQDLSPIFTSLQQELSSAQHEVGPDPGQQPGGPVAPIAYSNKEDADGDGVSVIRHLLEASDDELGIPSSGMDGGDNSDEKEMDGGDLPFSLCDGLWEFEDEAADYYSSLQSELFM